MFKVQTFNKISPKGLDLLPRDRYEIASEFTNPDAIILRSYKMNDMELPVNLKAVARAGAGVNNIPVDRCSERGVVVFNTPGSNANSVKELVLLGLFLSTRKVFQGMSWVKSIADKGDEVPKIIEKEKSNFAGPELRGKTLGVIGLGAIGAMVANDALQLGMNVMGCDPFISVDSAWKLSSEVKKAHSVDSLISQCDFISIHTPLNDKTRGMFDKEKFSMMKKGVRILNFARGGLVNNMDLKAAINEGIVECYVTDFPDEELVNMDKVLCIPHLGASTPEAEDNSAVMAAGQLRSFLETGNIKNSVNFPECSMPFNNANRILVANKNIPNMVGQISTILANENINIDDMINRHRDDYAYNIIDVKEEVPDSVIDTLKQINGVIMARKITSPRE
jgi:D-3-phosphoglycerate dehydrogenase